MKKCSVCKQEKPADEFNKNKARKDGLQSHCRDCSHEKFKKYWESNKEKQLATVMQRTKRVASESRAWVADYLHLHPCVDCGNSDIRVLEFDHVRGEKRSGVAKLVHKGYGLKAVQEEVAKCEVRCRNCHLLRTYERLGGTWHDEYIIGFEL